MSFDTKAAEAFGADKAEKIRAVLNNPESAFDYKTAQAFYDACYRKPKTSEVMMYAFNEILEGHGVEGVTDPEDMSEGMDYVNMGDTYATTIVKWNGSFRVESYGDRIEKLDW